MRLDPLVRDYPSFLDELIAVLEAPTTRIYLDTSLLMWLARIGGEARAEFLVWARARPPGTVRVPVWAAHELHKHLSANTIAVNVGKVITEAIKKYDEFVALAAERADDVSSRRHGFTSRTEFLSALNTSHTQVGRIAAAARVEDAQLRRATQEVISFANERMLETDLTGILQRLNAVGQFRYDHRVPPGFQDNKPENRFGDVILWEEILEDMAAARRTRSGSPRKRPLATNAIFLSRDGKTDWVSAAKYLSGVSGDASNANHTMDLDVALPHPTLLHEFRRRSGADKVFITHPAFLATTLDVAARRAGVSSPSRVWQAATHKLELVPKLDKVLEPFSQPVTIVEAIGDGAEAELADSPPDIAIDWNSLTVRGVATPVVTTEVAPLLNSLPADAQGALEALVARGTSGNLDGIHLGRAFAELTLARAANWPEQLAIQLERVMQGSPSRAQLALLAFMATGVFDRFGDPRRQPVADIFRAALGLEQDVRFSEAFSTFGRLVSAAGVALPYVPGSGIEVRYSVETGPAPAPFRLQAIRLGGQTALIGNLPAGSERTLTTLLGKTPEEGCTGQELRILLASEYLIPPGRLATSYDTKSLTWPDECGLQTLDMGGEGGLGSDLDTERYD